MAEYVDLNRNFYLAPKVDISDDFEDRVGNFSSKSLRWKNLELLHRVVILAEAGSGKTIEIQQATRRMRLAGKQAFFIRLEHIVDGLEYAFDETELGTFANFQQWLQSDDSGWIFLDSVDEARLTDPREFEKAIRKLGVTLGGAMVRTHIFVTSRVSEWRPVSDLKLLEGQLPYVAPVVVNSLADQDVDIIKGGADFTNFEITELKPPAEPESPFKVVSLSSLDMEQVRTLASAFQISNPERFFEEIERQDVSSYLSRPQDFVELVGFWKAYERIGSRLELIEADIENRLTERDQNRNLLKPLSFSKAISGAQRIAAAVTFQKQSRVKIPDHYDGIDGIDAAAVLDDWHPAEVQTLLSRPIFDQAIYGTVRFHHRSVREYLTAKWFSSLLAAGKSRRQIESLFFATQYGLEVIVPTTQPILSWLAIYDQPVRDRTLRIAPEVLFDGGDPSKLPKETKLAIIEMVCERIASEQSFRSYLNYGAIRRFASAELADSIRSLLEKYIKNADVNSLLLGLIWHAKLKSCNDLAFSILVDGSQNKYSRIAAIRALNASQARELITEAIDKILTGNAHPGRAIASELLDNFAPQHLMPTQIVSLLASTFDPNEHGYSGIERSLKNLIDRLGESDLAEILEGIAALLTTPPFVEKRQLEISSRHSWLLGFASGIAAKLVFAKSKFALTGDCLSVLSLYSLNKNWHGPKNDDPDLSDHIPNWPELNRSLFWYDVRDARRLLDKSKGERLKDWWQARIFRDFWSFNEADFAYLVSEISSQQLGDDKLVALSLAIQVGLTGNAKDENIRQLRMAAEENAELAEYLEGRLQPVEPSAVELQWKRQEATYKRRNQAHKREKAKNLAGWKSWLAENHLTMLNREGIPDGCVWNSQIFLHEQMRKAAPERNRWALGNWRDIIPAFGAEVAGSFRDSIASLWREFEPKVRSEGVENPNSVPQAIILGLCGLEIEAAETLNWPSAFAQADAERACRYGMWEMNGMPTWFPNLFRAFPDIVKRRFCAEIEWELSSERVEDDNHYLLSDLVHNGHQYDKAVSDQIMVTLRASFPSNISALENAITIIARNASVEDGRLADLACEALKNENSVQGKAVWCSLLFSVDPERGFLSLHQQAATINSAEEVTNFYMIFAVYLLGDRRTGGRHRNGFKSVGVLRRLYLVLHGEIRRDEDILRAGKGAYSPGLRDNAQEARNAVFSMIKEIPGKATYLILKEIAENHTDKDSQGWMLSYAKARAVLDADLPTWTAHDVKSFATDAERKPTAHLQLFELFYSRLLDLKDDQENGDTSIAAILKKADGETHLRNFVGGWLRDRANGKYAVVQEDENAEAKRPDLRFVSSDFDAPVPCEIKIADNWSGTVLFERVENQLCNDYLRDTRSSRGLFLLLHDGTKQKWTHPASKKKLSFSDLCTSLQAFSQSLIASRPDVEDVRVIGIDLALRKKPRRN